MVYSRASNLIYMPLKNKIIHAITAHPKIAIFGIALAIGFVIGTAIDRLVHQQAFAIFNSSDSKGN
ncbi:MAG: hypothetical protein ABJB76_05790 [Candidatus Nitrosocosmicus sp.]